MLGETELDGDALLDGERLGLTELEGETLAEGDGDRLALDEGLTLGEGLTDGEGLILALGLRLGDALVVLKAKVSVSWTEGLFAVVTPSVRARSVPESEPNEFEPACVLEPAGSPAR